METRKVQRLGPSTLAMTLPAAWTSSHEVEKGDELAIHQANETLLVSAERSDTGDAEAIIHVRDLGAEAVERAIIAQYVLGRRIIHIEEANETLPSDVIDAVYRAESQLMGLGVIEETGARITVRCSVDPDDFRLDNLLKRLESTGRTMRNEAIKALAHGDVDLAQRAVNRERQANKIFVLLLRLIFTAHQNPSLARAVGLDAALPLIGYRSVAKNLELTADNAEDIAEVVLEIEGETLDVDQATIREIREFTDQVNDITELAVESVTERDFRLSTEVRDRFHEIGNHETALLADLPDLPNQTLLDVREVLVSLREPVQYAMRNAEIAANLALYQESEHVSF